MKETHKKPSSDDPRGPSGTTDSRDGEGKYPGKHTEQERDRKAGSMNREEIRERTHRNKE